jgi:cell division protein FtsI/penicillin-binding protein 2
MVKSRKTDTYDSRLVFLRYSVIFFAIIILFQLFTRSVVDHKTVLASAQSQQLTKENVEPKRGTIYASSESGTYPVATTNEVYTISLVPKNIKDKKKTAQKLADILDLDGQEIFDKINNNKVYLPPTAQRVEREKALKIVDLNIPGVLVVPTYARYYPEDSLASQVLGFVDFDNIGHYGIEGYYNDVLRGLGGTIKAQKDSLGRLISSFSTNNSAQNGDTLVLSIDQNVQYVAQEKLEAAIKEYKASSGQIAIVDVKTGAIIAMASSPNFNPNTFNEVKPEDIANFSNPIISSVYEPGSIMKPIVVAAGIDSGKLDPKQEGDYGAYVMVGSYKINTATFKAFGHENVTQVLENSDNVAMVSYANQIGNQTMYDYFQKIGLDSKTGIDSDGETTGHLKPANKWPDILRATASFGQGIAVTPLQILMAYQAIGNNGVLVQPHIVSKIIKPNGSERVIATKTIRQVFKPSTTSILKDMLISVVTNGEGKKAAVPGYVIGGKTGTAQIPNPDAKGYLEDAHIGSFAGLVPADNPRFAMLVKLDKPTTVKFAESSAAPTFSQVAQFLLQYYQIPKTQ